MSAFLVYAFLCLPARPSFSVCLSTAACQFLPFDFCLPCLPAKLPFSVYLSPFTVGAGYGCQQACDWEMQAQRITLRITQMYTVTFKDIKPALHPTQPSHQPPTPPPVSSQDQNSRMIPLISQHHRLSPTPQWMSQQWPVMCPLSSGLLQLT